MLSTDIENKENSAYNYQEHIPNRRKDDSKTKTRAKTSQNIVQGEDENMEIFGFKPNFWRSFVVQLGYILTFGILRLVFHWYPNWALMSTFEKCPLVEATKLLIIDNFQGKYKSYFVEEIRNISVCDTSLRNTHSKIENISDKLHPDVESANLIFQLEDGSKREVPNIRVFWVKKLCYIWDENHAKFMRLIGLDKGIKNFDFHNYSGYSKTDQILRRIIYGPNEINVPVQSILTLLVLEALDPFYIFQLFTLVVWILEYYYYYTIAILIMSIGGITSSIVQTRKNQLNLRGTVHSMEKVRVSRGGTIVEDVPSSDLVPGDVLLVPAHGCTMACDAVLLEGHCIVNESMLTGESVPVTKTPLPKSNTPYNIKEDNNHTLYCGTKIIQTRFYGSENVRAVVIRTGYLTTKGELVRSILYPPPADFKFDKDSYHFIGILAFIAFCGFLYTIISKSTRGLSTYGIMIKALDIITIVIPPALPAAMTVGKLYAISRLKKSKIFCMNSRVINVTGSINCVCFDKTGTLTEDGLDMWGVVPVSNGALSEPLKDAKNLPIHSSLLLGMVTCHSLTLIDSQLSGDPLDLKMFESTGWVLEEPEVDDTAKFDLLVPTVVKSPYPRNGSTSEKLPFEFQLELGIVHQFQFSSTLQRMSVITRTLGSDQFQIFCKGSPEMILSLSKPDTVPKNVLSVLKTYTEQGYRVIALGNRLLEENYHKIAKTRRDELEKDLTFQGLIVLENQLKPQTSGVIDTLKKAGIKVVMITGDNIQTALSVARECGIVDSGDKILDTLIIPDKMGPRLEFHETGVPRLISNSVLQAFEDGSGRDLEASGKEVQYHLAMTGKQWALAKEYFPEVVPKLVTRGTVFARMSGEQKQQLILELQSLGYYVAMCGDGANDCGALKAAHTGISLSDAESSVASPFTSTEANISCIPKVIREGRAALVTSFGVFKFMVAYSLTEFLSVIILYGIDSNLTNLQFLFIDICLVVNFASFFGKTSAYSGKLAKVPPATSLLGFIPLISLVFLMVINIFFQYLAFYVVQTFDWFVPFNYNEMEPMYFSSYENYAVFTVSLFQYIIMVVVYSKGKPYREPFYSNLTFFTSILIMLAICSYITVFPAKWVLDTLEIMLPPVYNMRIIVLVMALVNFILCLVVESFIVEYLLQEKVKPYFQNLEKSSKKYLKINKELEEHQWWLSEYFNKIKHSNGIDSVHVTNEQHKTINGYVNGNLNKCETTKL